MIHLLTDCPTVTHARQRQPHASLLRQVTPSTFLAFDRVCEAEHHPSTVGPPPATLADRARRPYA